MAKKLLQWPMLPAGPILSSFTALPGIKEWIDYERHNALRPMKIPKVCYESQARARSKLMLQAMGVKPCSEGDARIGNRRVSAEQLLLSQVKATGTVFGVRGLLPFILSLWEADSPHRSEKRLNRFLVQLGRDLSSTKARQILPDWIRNVDQTERFIVEGWCDSIVVDGQRWPSLCCFTTPALVKFLRLCDVKHCKLGQKDSRAVERAIQRLGLVRIKKGRIKHVEKRGGNFYFR